MDERTNEVLRDPESVIRGFYGAFGGRSHGRARIDGFEYRAHEVDVFHVRNEDQGATDRLWSADS